MNVVAWERSCCLLSLLLLLLLLEDDASAVKAVMVCVCVCVCVVASLFVGDRPANQQGAPPDPNFVNEPTYGRDHRDG